jgi:hypothetical protein
MEIIVGESPESGSSKAIVFVEQGVCYLRNWRQNDRLRLTLDSECFLSDVALLIDHENLHQLLFDIGEVEASHKLNAIDGFAGHLISRKIRCFMCRKLITKPPYVGHLLMWWHKRCLERFKKLPEYEKLWRVMQTD